MLICFATSLSSMNESSSSINESSSSSEPSSKANTNTNTNGHSVNLKHPNAESKASSLTGDPLNLKKHEAISPASASAISSLNTSTLEESLLNLKLVYFHSNSSQPFHSDSDDFILSNLDIISFVIVFFPLCYFTIVLIATLFFSVSFH